MSATGRPPEIDAYVDAVREALADLPAEEREDLLEEVEASLLATAEDDGRSAFERLGPPLAFAAELRASAGLDAEPEPARRSLPAARELARRVAADPRAVSTRRVAHELAPIWWLLRAYVVLALIAELWGDGWSITHPDVPRVASGGTGVLLAAAVVAGSIAAGLAARRRGGHTRALAVAANVALAVAAVPVAGHLNDVSAPVQYVPYPYEVAGEQAGLRLHGQPVTNIYPYARDGRPLLDVLLYDQYGTPLDMRPDEDDPNRRLLVTAGGHQIFNSFPIRYFEPGTTTVADPHAGPSVAAPDLLAPPLLSAARG